MEIANKLTSPEECGICYDSLTKKNSQTDICCSSHPKSHIYHSDCLKQWIATNIETKSQLGCCPSCRNNFNISKYGWAMLTNVFISNLKTAQKDTHEAFLADTAMQIERIEKQSLAKYGSETLKYIIQQGGTEIEDSAMDEILDGLNDEWQNENNATTREIELSLIDVRIRMTNIRLRQSIERENTAVKNILCLEKLKESNEHTVDLVVSDDMLTQRNGQLAYVINMLQPAQQHA